MNIFLTGATGYIGSHCMAELLQAGHSVTALSRRNTNPEREDVSWLKGSLETLSEAAEAIAASDIIMHCAMGYTEKGEASDVDATAMETMLASGKFIVATGNLYSCATDSSGYIPEALEDNPVNWRNETEVSVVQAPSGGASIRLGFVYGGTGGYFWQVFAPNEKDEVLYCGEDNNSWPMVHVTDVARLYRMVAEQKAAGIYHAWDGNNTAVETMVAVACHYQGGKPTHTDHTKAHARLGAFANHMQRTITPASGRAIDLGWNPTQSRFIEASEAAFHAYTQHQAARA